MNLNQVISFFLPTYSNGNFNRQDFKTDFVGTSDCNIFVPFYSVFGHELILFEEIDKKVLEYCLPIANSDHSVRQYEALIRLLRISQNPHKYYFKLQGIDHVINVHRGILYDNDKNILMCLSINSEYLLNTPVEEIAAKPDINQFVLFISHEFNAPKYKNVKKKIDLEYLSKIRQLNIDIIETSKINHWLFKNNFKQPKFKSVIEMNKHLKEEVPMNLLAD
jgi:hypothetical protein